MSSYAYCNCRYSFIYSLLEILSSYVYSQLHIYVTLDFEKPTKLSQQAYISFTIYGKTFKRENFCGSSTIFIMLGKLSQFSHNRLFQCSNQCSNCEAGNFSVVKHMHLVKIHENREIFYPLNAYCVLITKQENFSDQTFAVSKNS